MYKHNVDRGTLVGKHCYRGFLLSCRSALQLSWDVPVDADFLCDKAVVLGETIKKYTLYTNEHEGINMSVLAGAAYRTSIQAGQYNYQR